MPQENQQDYNEILQSLERTVSPERFNPYLQAAGFNAERALNLYIWNAKICGAFYLPLQATEVGLRNCVNGALTSVFGPEWWRDDDFLNLADVGARNSLAVVFKRIKNIGLEISTPQVVAGLSFGFWVSVLDASYNIEIWSQQLPIQFPNLPENTTRETLKNRSAKTADFRNRVSHHEPIFKSNISVEYSQLMELLAWICPSKRQWIKENSDVPKLMRVKP